MFIVPTTMTEAEEVLGMFEEVITVMTINTEVASKVFTNKVFNIHNNQSSKDIFMKENEDEEEEEEEVSSFDNLLSLLNNNNKLSPMTTTRPLWWWLTKDVLRRTTETQLDEEDYDVDDIDDESVEENDGGKRRDKGEGIRWEEPRQELSLKARAHTSTRFTSSLCVLWRVREAILWWLSLFFGDGNYEWKGYKDPAPNLTTQKAPSLSSGEVVIGGCCTRLLEVGGMGNTKGEGNR